MRIWNGVIFPVNSVFIHREGYLDYTLNTIFVKHINIYSILI